MCPSQPGRHDRQPQRVRLPPGQELFANTGTRVAAFLGTADIGYRADFVAFDQWGQDFGYLRDPNPAGDIRHLNAAHWSNYLLYVQTIRSALNLPAVLWQIACGHLNSTRTQSYLRQPTQLP